MKAHDCIKLVQAIKENEVTIIGFEYCDLIAKSTFINALCSILKAENKNFDEQKFRKGLK
jgi:hypothetical protein